MDLGSLVKKSRDVTVTFEDEKLTFTYVPNRLDSHVMQRLRATSTENFDALTDVLALLLKSWDLTEDGKPIKPDKETLLRLPFSLMTEVSSALLEDFNSPKAPTLLKNGS